MRYKLIFLFLLALVGIGAAAQLAVVPQVFTAGDVKIYHLPETGRHTVYWTTLYKLTPIPDGKTLVYMRLPDYQFVSLNASGNVFLYPRFPTFVNSKVKTWIGLSVSKSVSNSDIVNVWNMGPYAKYAKVSLQVDNILQDWKWRYVQAFGGRFPYPTNRGYFVVFDPSDPNPSGGGLVTALGSKDMFSIPLFKDKSGKWDYAYSNSLLWHELMHGEGIDQIDYCSDEYNAFYAYCTRLGLPVDFSKGCSFVCGNSMCYTDHVTKETICTSYIRDEYQQYYYRYLIETYLNPEVK